MRREEPQMNANQEEGANPEGTNAFKRVKECLLEPLRRTTRDLFGVVSGIWAGDRLARRADHKGVDGEHSTSTADSDQVCAADRRQ